MRNHVCALFALFTPLCVPLSQGAPQDLTHTVISGFVNNEKHKFPYTIEVNLVPFNKGHRQPHYHGYAGDGEFVCTSLSIVLNGRKIEIPKRAYIDLAEITSVSSPDDAEHESWTLQVFGGSGGECYVAEFLFNNTRLLERRFVEHFPAGQERKYRDVEKY